MEERPSSSIVEAPSTKTIMEEIEEDSKKDKKWNELKKRFQDDWVTEENGIKKWRGRIYVPGEKTRERIMKEHHDAPIAGHPGRHRMHESIARTFWWPTIRRDIREYVDGCQTCQKTRPSNRPRPTSLQPSEIPQKPWQRISVDLIGPLPRSKDSDAIMVVIDYFTKMGHFIPTNTTLTAEGAARLYVENIFKLHGVPESITSDRGPQFASHFAEGFRKMLGIEGRLSTAYHPQTDGQTEIVNKEVEQYLRRFANYEQDDWAEWLPMAEFAHNDHVNSSTSFTPFYLNYGQDPWRGITPIPPHPNESATEFVTRMHAIREEAQAALRYTKEDMKRFHDRLQKPSITYQQGDKVWLEGTNLTTQRPSKKLEFRRFGPFTILSKHGTAYKLSIPTTWKHIHPVFHETLLTPFTPPAFSTQNTPPPPPPDLIDDHPEYEVESILKVRKWGRGIRYLVHWKGYSHEEDTWEPRSNLRNATDALANFYQKNPGALGQNAMAIVNSLNIPKAEAYRLANIMWDTN
jgi:hypothetical protein